jgi:hypothetical protein
MSTSAAQIRAFILAVMLAERTATVRVVEEKRL